MHNPLGLKNKIWETIKICQVIWYWKNRFLFLSGKKNSQPIIDMKLLKLPAWMLSNKHYCRFFGRNNERVLGLIL